jgi:N4-(beta-N-acetylglucosaminyl)-L-asparaginase
MTPRITRRRFVAAGVAAGAAAGVAAAMRPLFAAAPAVIVPGAARPTVVASANAAKFTNGGPRTGIAEAFERLTRGEDVLDALLAGVNILELDPEEDSVGYGGLPNADGVVQLDACCMHGPKRRAGAGARDFARRLGFRIEDDLNTEHSRRLWLEWKRLTDPAHYPDPANRAAAADRARREMVARGLVSAESVWGTVHCNGINAKGEMAGVTTTSGLAWKIPGRVGDSPILGAGNYVDGAVGAAGSTGRGEANLYGLSSFLIVEQMRQGKHPKDAALEALGRIRAATTEKRLLRPDGRPNFQVKFYALDRAGRHAGVAMYGGVDVTYAVATENGPVLLPMEPLLPGSLAD